MRDAERFSPSEILQRGTFGIGSERIRCVARIADLYTWDRPSQPANGFVAPAQHKPDRPGSACEILSRFSETAHSPFIQFNGAGTGVKEMDQ